MDALTAVLYLETARDNSNCNAQKTGMQAINNDDSSPSPAKAQPESDHA
jgi:hypothetical protein